MAICFLNFQSSSASLCFIQDYPGNGQADRIHFYFIFVFSVRNLQYTAVPVLNLRDAEVQPFSYTYTGLKLGETEPLIFCRLHNHSLEIFLEL
jgi:hypothetical protein